MHSSVDEDDGALRMRDPEKTERNADAGAKSKISAIAEVENRGAIVAFSFLSGVCEDCRIAGTVDAG